MKTTLLAAFLGLANFTYSQIVTNVDNAANYGGSNPNWTNGSNAGSGFSAWNLYSSGTAGNFLGSSLAQGFGNIDTSGQSFAMWGNPSGDNYFNAERTFVAPLNVGDTFSIDLAIAFRNGSKGISLFSGGFGPANEVWNFNVGANNYTAGGTNLEWAYSQTSVFQILVTQTNESQLAINLSRGLDLYTATVNVTSGLSGFRLYVGSTDAGNDLNNLFLNNLKTTIVPEPSVYFLLVSSAVALMGYNYRRSMRRK